MYNLAFISVPKHSLAIKKFLSIPKRSLLALALLGFPLRFLTLLINSLSLLWNQGKGPFALFLA